MAGRPTRPCALCWGVQTFVEVFSDLRLRDVRRVLLPYVSVVAMVSAIVALGLVLPGPRVVHRPNPLSQFSAPAAAGVAPVDELAEVAAVAPSEGDPFAVAAATNPGFDDSPVAPIRPAATFSPADGGSAAATDPGPTPAPSSDAPTTTTVMVSPLRIVGSTWASRTAGTPLAAQGVPESSLPVGSRLGQPDKASFIRLDGTATSLLLAPHEDASGQRSPDAGAIQACQITDAEWKDGEAISFDAAPAYDETTCSAGVRNPDGTWTFDLAGFPGRADDRGFALVPGPDVPLDFQVSFGRAG